MVDPPVFPHILGIAAALFLSNAIVVFPQAEARDIPGRSIKVRRPPEDRFRERGRIDIRFCHDEGDEEGVFVDDDSSPSAESFDHGDVIFFDFRKIEKLLGLARDAHDNRPRGAEIDDAKISGLGAKERLFELELLEDGDLIEENPMKIRANRRSP